MRLFEIDEEMLNLIDPETGEIMDFDAFESLSMQRDEKIENMCLWHKELMAEASAIKQEIENLQSRKKAAENKAERLKEYIDYILNGQKFKTPKVIVSYRTSKSVKTDDDFVAWAQSSDIGESLLTYVPPKPSLSAIKEAINSGVEVEHATIEEKKSISIK